LVISCVLSRTWSATFRYDVAYLRSGGLGRADWIGCAASLHSRARSRAAGCRLAKFRSWARSPFYHVRHRRGGDLLRLIARHVSLTRDQVRGDSGDFRQTKQPYNQALQRTIPVLNEKGTELSTILGSRPAIPLPAYEFN
jgi:hypothetical protein